MYMCTSIVCTSLSFSFLAALCRPLIHDKDSLREREREREMLYKGTVYGSNTINDQKLD